ncbi:GIY-YIG nuclease family protein [Salmonella enterica]|nr:GIY-YIG nuclease family protein [Salmonella enterica]
MYNEVKGTRTEKNKTKIIMQNDRISALNLIQYKQIHKLPINEGMVYVIGNKAWPNCYKIGMTINVHDRLRSYQTYSPYRDFTLEHYQFYSDRRAVESKIHKFLAPFALEGEWFEILNLEELKMFLKQEKAKEYNVLID